MYAIASSHSGLQAGNIASRALVGQVPGGGAVSAARASVAPSIPTRAIDLGSLPGQRSRDRLLPARHKRKGTDASSCPPHLLPCILRANAGSTNSGVLNRRLAGKTILKFFNAVLTLPAIVIEGKNGSAAT